MWAYSVEGLSAALGIWYYILVYGVGVVAMVLSTAAYQLSFRVAIILCTLLGQSAWVVYFLLQGDLASAVACALTALMLGIFAGQKRWRFAKSPWCIALFILLLSAFSLLSFSGWSDIFPLLAGVLAVIANSRKSERALRIFSFFFCLFWLLNSTFKGYPVAFVNDLFCTVSTVIGLIRYREKAKK